MEKYEVELVLDTKLENLSEGPIAPEITIENWKFDKNIHCGIIKVEGETRKEAVSKAVFLFDDFLNIYYLQSLDSVRINPGTQIETRTLSGDKPKMERSINVFLQPVDPFDSKSFEKLKNEYLKIISLSKNEYIRIASDYFRRASLENHIENRIIDYFVSIEALYSLNGEKNEMRYRISNRIATLLGKNLEDRKETLKKSRDLYDLRSAIVHGSTPNLDPQILGNLHSWVRESILRFTELAKSVGSQEKIIELIDFGILENSERDSLRDLSKNYLQLVRDLK